MNISLSGLLNTCSFSCFTDNPPWSTFYPYILWNIWTARNKFVFQNVSFDVDNVLHLAYSQALEYWIVSELPKVSDAIGKTVVNLNWKFPPSPWHKLNCDGASSFESFLAGAGSVICNSSGVFVAALAHHLPSNSSTVAELWVVRDGLLLALKLQISYLIVDSDSSSTISFETIRLPVIGI